MVNLSDTPVCSDYNCQGKSQASSKTIYIQPSYNRAIACNNYMLTSNFYSDLNDYISLGSGCLVLFANIRIDHTSNTC